MMHQEGESITKHLIALLGDLTDSSSIGTQLGIIVLYRFIELSGNPLGQILAQLSGVELFSLPCWVRDATIKAQLISM